MNDSFMQLDKKTYIAGGYYLDFDGLGQLRIFGPNNHLYLGLVDIPRHKIRINSVEAEDGASLKMEGAFTASKINLYLPVMGDVRTLREVIGEFEGEYRSFLQIRESQHTLHGEAQPSRVEFLQTQPKGSRFDPEPDRRDVGRYGARAQGSRHEKKNNSRRPATVDRGPRLVFRRDYGESYYQSSFEFPAWVEVEEIEEPYKGFRLSVSAASSGRRAGLRHAPPAKKLSLSDSSGQAEIPFILYCETNDTEVYDRSCVLLGNEAIDFSVFGKDAEKVRRFWERTRIEVEHLLCWGKTSGDRFGTVFPRDWMESAALATSDVALGVGDIPAAGVDYMLKKSLAHVNEKGEGWHEDVVGEYKYKYEAAGKDLFDRKMIDIEPWYFICLRWVTDSFWQDKEAVRALRRSARYILRRAARQEYITFEPLPEDKEIPAWQKSFGIARGYWTVGDWRDSQWAYKHIHPIVAPFSVSAVFYPEALKMIAKIGEKIGVDRGEVDRLIEVWRHKKEAYRFEDYNGTQGFALALYDTWKQLRVHHLDEAYLYFLSDDYAKEDVLGFAKRVLDMEYFYTEAGPLIIARNNEMGYTDEEYHGLVVWTKQAAFTIAGLARALDPSTGLRRAQSSPSGQGWELSDEERGLLREAAIKTAQNLICAYCCLDSIPELHKDSNGRAVEWMRGTGSSVQLWSAVGARRIFREYERLVKS